MYFCHLWHCAMAWGSLINSYAKVYITKNIWANRSTCDDADHTGRRARYVKLRVAHAPGMPGTFSPLPRVNDPGKHHGTCVTHAPWCMPGSLTSDFLWGRSHGEGSRHSRRMRNPQFYVSGKRPMGPWPPFRKRYFQMYFNEWKVLHFYWKSLFLRDQLTIF